MKSTAASQGPRDRRLKIPGLQTSGNEMLNVRSFPSTTEIHQVDGYVSFVPTPEVKSLIRSPRRRAGAHLGLMAVVVFDADCR